MYTERNDDMKKKTHTQRISSYDLFIGTSWDFYASTTAH